MTQRILEKRIAAIKLIRYPEFSPLRKLWELGKTLSGDFSAVHSRASVVPELSAWGAV